MDQLTNRPHCCHLPAASCDLLFALRSPCPPVPLSPCLPVSCGLPDVTRSQRSQQRVPHYGAASLPVATSRVKVPTMGDFPFAHLARLPALPAAGSRQDWISSGELSGLNNSRAQETQGTGEGGSGQLAAGRTQQRSWLMVHSTERRWGTIPGMHVCPWPRRKPWAILP